MMGGDYAPLEAVKGVKAYLAGHNSPAHLLLIGNEPAIRQLLAEHEVPENHITVVHAEEVSFRAGRFPDPAAGPAAQSLHFQIEMRRFPG